MRSPHGAFIALFLAASTVACVALPLSLSHYVRSVEHGFGATANMESARLISGNSTGVLALRCRYSSPQRLETQIGNYTLAVAGAGVALWFNGSLNGSANGRFGGGVSDVIVVSGTVTASQGAALRSHPAITVSYYIWVYATSREGGSPLSGSADVTLGVV